MGFILLNSIFRPNILIFHKIQFLFNIFIEEKNSINSMIRKEIKKNPIKNSIQEI